MPGIVIIGAGHAGIQLVASLRESGFAGQVTVLSADPDLPYHKPPLSKSFMKAPDAPLQPLRAETFFAEKEITLNLGCDVTGVDREGRRVICADGSIVAYDKLVLATGTKARALDLPGADLKGVHTLRTGEDARALRAALPGTRRVAVIGGGFIGLEATAMLASRGIGVSVVELAPRVLGRATSSIVADTVTGYLTGLGVGMRLGETVHSIEGAGGQVSGIRLSGGLLPADLVLIGVGAVPLDGLAREAGLAVENGILVDEYLATQDPAIFAIGDCVAFPQPHLGRKARLESVQNATDQARALAATLTGTPTKYLALPWFWSDIGELKLQIAGLAEDADEALVTRSGDGRPKSVYRMREGRLVAAETLNSAGEHMLARRMIAEGITPAREVLETGDARAIKSAYLQMKT